MAIATHRQAGRAHRKPDGVLTGARSPAARLWHDCDDSDCESDVDDSGYDTCPEPPSPRSCSPQPAIHAVTAVDVLELLRQDASSPVPFPYKAHWPAIPSPPPTPTPNHPQTAHVEPVAKARALRLANVFSVLAPHPALRGTEIDVAPAPLAAALADLVLPQASVTVPTLSVTPPASDAAVRAQPRAKAAFTRPDLSARDSDSSAPSAPVSSAASTISSTTPSSVDIAAPPKPLSFTGITGSKVSKASKSSTLAPIAVGLLTPRTAGFKISAASESPDPKMASAPELKPPSADSRQPTRVGSAADFKHPSTAAPAPLPPTPRSAEFRSSPTPPRSSTPLLARRPTATYLPAPYVYLDAAPSPPQRPPTPPSTPPPAPRAVKHQKLAKPPPPRERIKSIAEREHKKSTITPAREHRKSMSVAVNPERDKVKDISNNKSTARLSISSPQPMRPRSQFHARAASCSLADAKAGMRAPSRQHVRDGKLFPVPGAQDPLMRGEPASSEVIAELLVGTGAAACARRPLCKRERVKARGDSVVGVVRALREDSSDVDEDSDSDDEDENQEVMHALICAAQGGVYRCSA